MGEQPGERRIDAAEANRMASELDQQPYEAIPVDDDSAVGRVPDSDLEQPRQSDRRPLGSGVFPPDVGGVDAIGGSPEEQEMLREEEAR